MGKTLTEQTSTFIRGLVQTSEVLLYFVCARVLFHTGKWLFTGCDFFRALNPTAETREIERDSSFHWYKDVSKDFLKQHRAGASQM